MPKRASLALAAILVATLFAAPACANMDRSPPSAGAPPAAAAADAAKASGADPLAPIGQRALRITVETSLVVDDLDVAVAALRGAAEQRGGRVAQGRISGTGGSRYASFELRVPAADIAAFRAELARLGEVTSESETAEDVTEQRADVQARLRNARAQEKRLLDLLSDKTGSLGDVVLVEKELATVRETIERIEAQERVLEGQIAFATVKVQVSTRQGPGAGAGSRIARAAREGIHAAGAFCVGLVLVAAMAGPTTLILALMGASVFVGIRSFLRWRKRRGVAKGQQSAE